MNYDAYLVHASDNARDAKALVDALKQRGLTVWFNRFIVGPSIREQMESGLRESDFGIVMLSPEFFAKKWTRHELDALFGLESPDEVRILPVWWGTTEEEVRKHSPMLAMRSAAVLGDSGVDGVADALVESILSLSAYASPAKKLRLQIASGLPWRDGPLWMAASMAEYDRTFGDDYLFTDLDYYPDLQPRLRGQPVPLLDLLKAHTFWDGKRLSVVGRQVHGSVQVFDELVPGDELPADPSRPSDASVASYVFQLNSVEFARGELCYVHCIGLYSRSNPGMGPYPPAEDWLCWVTGLLLAFGHMSNSRGDVVAAAYFAASSIMFTPRLETEDPAGC